MTAYETRSLRETVLNYYNSKAKALFEKYQSLDPNKVHASWLDHIPLKPGLALDVGGGSGRDAGWLAQRGWEVVAVEPAEELFELGQKATDGYSVKWVDDCLPGLTKLKEYQQKFTLILVSGVLMHLPPQQRLDSLETLVSLMAKGSVLVITLRQGPDSDDREFYQVPATEIVQFAIEKTLHVEVKVALEDELKRSGVSWQVVILKNQVIE